MFFIPDQNWASTIPQTIFEILSKFLATGKLNRRPAKHPAQPDNTIFFAKAFTSFAKVTMYARTATRAPAVLPKLTYQHDELLITKIMALLGRFGIAGNTRLTKLRMQTIPGYSQSLSHIRDQLTSCVIGFTCTRLYIAALSSLTANFKKHHVRCPAPRGKTIATCCAGQTKPPPKFLGRGSLTARCGRCQLSGLAQQNRV